MKLYHAPLTRSTRVLWLLEELGLPYELEVVDVFTGKGRTAEHRARHPHGYVPALALDAGGVTLIESSAICMHLADGVPGVAPALGTPERARYYQWMVYFPATADPHLEAIMFHTRFLPEERRLPALVATSKKRWAAVEQVMAKELADGRPFFLGDRFSPVDVLAGTCLAWARVAGALGEEPALLGYLARLSERPAFQAAHR